MEKKQFFAFLLFCLVSQLTLAQNQITGVVSDSEGLTLPGVNIIEKGTSNGVVSDFDGNYSISVNSNATLVLSYIGFETQEINVAGKSIINVTLEENLESLDEVVVIGYGTQNKNDINSAISSVKAKDLENSTQVSIDQMLQGKASGLTVANSSGKPGSAASIKIRGITSIGGTNEPLYVIDGVQISGDATSGATSGRPIAGSDFVSQGNNSVSPLALLNPNDIESVDILKDASATAIYGNRGANGVIIITTKSGKRGTGKMSYNTSMGFQEIPQHLDMMNLREYAKVQNALAEVLGVEPRAEFANPGLLGEGTDWQDEIFRSASITNHQLSFSGGKEGINYFLSGGFLDQEGTLIGSGFKRYTIRLNTDAKVKDWLRVGAYLNGAITNETININSNYNGIISNTLYQAPDLAVRNLDGSFSGPSSTDESVSLFNPVAQATVVDNKLIRKNFLGTVFAEATLFNDHIKYRLEVAANTEFSENNQFTPSYKWGINENPVADLSKRRQNWYSTNLKNLITYTDTYADKHNVTVLVGNEFNDSHWEGLLATATGFLSDGVQTISVADSDLSTVNDYQGSQGLLSFFGRIIYDFDDRYSFTASYRADGSSKFNPAVSELQWGYFPSAAVSWKLSNETFMENTKDYVDNIKIRAGYGETGNAQIGNNAYTSTLTFYSSGLGVGPLVDNIPNPDVTWETQSQTNFGLGFTMLDSRLSFNLDLYKKESEGFLFRQPLPNYLTGGTEGQYGAIIAPVKNLGSMENTGFDLEIGYKTYNDKDFSWNTSFNVSRYKNEVTSIPEGIAGLNGVINTNGFLSSTVTQTKAGQPIGMFYGYQVEGLFRDLDDLNSAPIQFGNPVGTDPGNTYLGDIKYKDVNGDGVIDEKDRGVIGTPHPDFTFGLSNNFKYKNLDLSLFLQGSYGNDILNLTRRSNTTNSRLYQNQLAEAGDFWTPENPDASLPRPIGSPSNRNLEISDRYIEDGSYLRIQNVTIGYSVPLDVLSKLNMSRLRIYASAQNLVTFTDYSGYDPEVGSVNQDPLLNGIDNGRYPSSRTISLGLNVEF